MQCFKLPDISFISGLAGESIPASEIDWHANWTVALPVDCCLSQQDQIERINIMCLKSIEHASRHVSKYFLNNRKTMCLKSIEHACLFQITFSTIKRPCTWKVLNMHICFKSLSQQSKDHVKNFPNNQKTMSKTFCRSEDHFAKLNFPRSWIWNAKFNFHSSWFLALKILKKESWFLALKNSQKRILHNLTHMSRGSAYQHSLWRMLSCRRHYEMTPRSLLRAVL